MFLISTLPFRYSTKGKIVHTTSHAFVRGVKLRASASLCEPSHRGPLSCHCFIRISPRSETTRREPLLFTSTRASADAKPTLQVGPIRGVLFQIMSLVRKRRTKARMPTAGRRCCSRTHVVVQTSGLGQTFAGRSPRKAGNARKQGLELHGSESHKHA